MRKVKEIEDEQWEGRKVLRGENKSLSRGNILVWDQSQASAAPFLPNIL